MVFRKLRTKRQIRDFQENADPALLAQEIAALKRENSEAPNPEGPLTPTSIGAEIFPTTRRFFGASFERIIPALSPSESSWKVRGMIEPEGIDQPKD
jgi:hypothetical protein